MKISSSFGSGTVRGRIMKCLLAAKIWCQFDFESCLGLTMAMDSIDPLTSFFLGMQSRSLDGQTTW